MRRIIIADNVLSHQFGDESVILNLNNETYYRLNGMAMEMWQTLSASGTVEQAHDALLTQFDVSAEELSRDLDDFVAYLQSANLITIEQQDA